MLTKYFIFFCVCLIIQMLNYAAIAASGIEVKHEVIGREWIGQYMHTHPISREELIKKMTHGLNDQIKQLKLTGLKQYVTQSMPHTVLLPISYPVHSKRLTPGQVARRQMSSVSGAPIFLIGDDARSRNWLQRQASYLETIHAVGIVINIVNARALEKLQELAPNLPLYPMVGDDLAKQLALHHYPVLIDNEYITQ